MCFNVVITTKVMKHFTEMSIIYTGRRLMTLSTIVQWYRSVLFYCWRKPENSDKVLTKLYIIT
jgi:hypothetical protein